MAKHVRAGGKICTIDNCEEAARSRGWCSLHYQRWYQNGDPEFVAYVRTRAPEESFALRTEWQGDCLIWVGSKTSDGYGRLRVSGRVAYAHRYAWEKVNGPIPHGMVIDHKNHCDRACVNVDHLRLVTPQQNSYHRSGAEKGSKSGIRNVHQWRGKWQVVVVKNGKYHYFGVYDDIDEAAEVAQAAREELFGAYAGRRHKYGKTC